MTKRTVAWFAAGFLILVSLVIGAFGLSGVRTVRIEGEEIQKRIDALLPKEHKNVKLTKATVNFAEKDVAIALSFEGKLLKQQFSLDAVGVGVPKYRQEDSTFYFHPSKLTVSRLEFSGESGTDKARKFADRYVTDPKLKERITSSLPGVEQWVKDNVESYALTLFERMPLYTPKNDMKGIILKATLEDVAIDNGALVLSFSLWELTKTVFVAAVLLLLAIGMIGALLLCPELFLLAAFIPH